MTESERIKAEKRYYKEHLSGLRRAYVRSTPAQRANIARQRMELPECTPNILITSVSATEGLARSIVLHSMIAQGGSIDKTYPVIRKWDPERLVSKFAWFEDTTPEALFGDLTWMRFRWSVEYRHFLIHEGTFLNQNDGGKLISATRHIFYTMQRLATTARERRA